MNKKRFAITSMIVAIISVLAVSCYYDNEEALYPNLSNTCDSSNVTYSATISTIINGYCINCHSGSLPSGGVSLGSYSNVKALATSGTLINAIKGSGLPQMPPSGGLNSCRVNQVNIWIRNGMLNN